MAYFFRQTTGMGRGSRLAETSIAAKASAAITGLPFVYLAWIAGLGAGDLPDLLFYGALVFFGVCGLSSVAEFVINYRRKTPAYAEFAEAAEEVVPTTVV